MQSCRALPQYMSAGVSSEASYELVSIIVTHTEFTLCVSGAGAKYKGRAMDARQQAGQDGLAGR